MFIHFWFSLNFEIPFLSDNVVYELSLFFLLYKSFSIKTFETILHCKQLAEDIVNCRVYIVLTSNFLMFYDKRYFFFTKWFLFAVHFLRSIIRPESLFLTLYPVTVKLIADDAAILSRHRFYYNMAFLV